jgi:hypothetical protein
LQQRAQVYFDVAGVGAQSFEGGSLTQAGGYEAIDELLAEAFGQTLEAAADGGFVDVEG